MYFHQFLVVGRKSLKFSPPGFSLERLKHKCLRKRLRRPIWPKLGSLGTGSSCGVGFSVEDSQIPQGGGDPQRFEGAPPQTLLSVLRVHLCHWSLGSEFGMFEEGVGFEEVRYTSREKPDEHRGSGRPSRPPVTTSVSKRETSSQCYYLNQSKIQLPTNSTRTHRVLKGQQLMWYNSQKKKMCFEDQTQRPLTYCPVSPHRQMCPPLPLLPRK